MIYSPIWKDIVFNTENIPFDYIIKKDGVVLHTGYASSYPGSGMVSINVNQLVGEYLSPEFDGDIREVDDEVVANPKAYGVFNITDEGGNEYETYGFLGDWSYVDGWSGQTNHLMSQPINGHLDPRMRIMCSYFNTGQASISYSIDGYISVVPDSINFKSIDRGTGSAKSVSVQADGPWSASISGWSGFSLSNISSGGFDVVLASGDSVSQQNASVTILCGTKKRTVPVSISNSISVVPQSQSKHYTGDGTGYTITITSDVDWHQWTPGDGGTGSNDYGLVFTPSSGTSGTTVVEVTAPLNTGATGGDVSCSIVATEGLKSVILSDLFTIGYFPHYTADTSPRTVVMPSGGSTTRVDVVSNATISGVTSDSDWLVVTPRSSNPYYFEVSASTNTKAVPRTGVATVTLVGSSFTAKTEVIQSGKTIVGGTNLVDYEATSKVVPQQTSSYYWGAELVENNFESGVGQLVFDDSITGIAPGAFSGNTDLTLVKIPSLVTAVYTGAFSGCTNLMTIYVYSSNITNPASNAFTGLPNGGTLHLPSGIPSSTYTRWVQIFGAKSWTIVQDL